MADSLSNLPDTGDTEDWPEPQSLRYNLDSLEDYLTVSERVANEGRFDEAVDVMREANRRYPESPTGRYNLGVALFLRLKEDKEHLELWENLADDEQYADEATAALESAIDADPSYVAAHNNVAKLYALRGRNEDAIRAWETSLRLDPEQSEVAKELDMYRRKISPSASDMEERALLNDTKPEGEL